MATVTICSDFGAPKIKSDTVSTVSPSISHEVMGPDASLGLFFFFLSPVFSFFSENHLGTSSVYSILQISTPSFLESEESSVVK